MGWWCFLGVWSPVRPVLSPTSQITSKLNCPAHTDWPPASSSPPLCWKAKSLVQGSRLYRQSWKCETRAKCHVFASVKIWFNQRGHILWWLLHSYLSWVALIDWMGRVRQALSLQPCQFMLLTTVQTISKVYKPKYTTKYHFCVEGNENGTECKLKLNLVERIILKLKIRDKSTSFIYD